MRRRSLRHDAATAEHVTAIGDGKRIVRHLIDNQQGHAFVPQTAKLLEQFGNDRRRKSQRRLIEQQHFGPRQQPTRNREHLLLAAREQTCRRMQPWAQAREALQHAFDLAFRKIMAARSAEAKVFRNRQLREHLPPFRHQDQAGPRDQRGCKRRQVLAAQFDSSAHGTDQAAQRLHQRRFPGTVRAEKRNHLAAPDLEADIVEYGQGALTGAQALDLEQRCSGGTRRS